METALPFELHLRPAVTGLRVISFSGEETMSAPFSFEVLAAVSGSAPPASDLVGLPATLRMTLEDDTSRDVHGLLAHVAMEDMRTVNGLLTVRVRLVPRLWLLSRDRENRIFQDATLEAIVTKILKEYGVPFRWQVSRSFREREYRVQYRESTLGFLERLLAEEGVFYSFAHTSDGGEPEEVVVFGDQAADYAPVPGKTALRFAEAGALIGGERVRRFLVSHDVCPDDVLLTGYDFRRPAFDLRGRASQRNGNRKLRVHEHHGDLDERDIGDALARRHLDSHRAAAEQARGESSCRRLSPGLWFDLAEHPNAELDGRYAIVGVKHTGRQGEASGADGAREVYSNDFTCVPGNVVWRPGVPDHPLQQVTETATVVGPAGEDIHTDAYGRVKVQFHWDQLGQGDETSSCWLRTMQPWAGSAWGAQFLPRVGMEVVVTFTGGDVDRPMILGTVYNGLHPPPFALPENKTQSGIRTQSTPGSGSNELRFEDAAGREQIYVHAQRDFDTVVEQDYTRTVHRDERLRVDADRTVDVVGNHHRTVQGSEVVSIHKHFVMHVAGRQVIHVDGVVSDDDLSEPEVVAPNEAAPTAMDAAALAMAEQLPSTERLSSLGRVGAARMLWMVEKLEGAHYAAGRDLRRRLDASSTEVTQVVQRAQQALREASPAADLLAIVGEAEGASARLAELSREASALASPDLHRVRAEALAQLDQLEGANHAARAAVVQAMSAVGVPDGSGSGRGGGGGGTVDAWKEIAKGSLLRIHGGGVIDSPEGLVLGGEGGSLDIQGGVMHARAMEIDISAPAINIHGHYISLKGDIIEISGATVRIEGGETIIKGAPIKLN